MADVGETTSHGGGPVTSSPRWAELQAHSESLRSTTIRQLFEAEPGRVQRCTVDAVGVHADLSKHRTNHATLDLLVRLAEDRGLPSRIDQMWSGARINTTENRLSLIHISEPTRPY